MSREIKPFWHRRPDDSIRAAVSSGGPYDGYLSARCPFDYFADQADRAPRHHALLGTVAVGGPTGGQFCQRVEGSGADTRPILRDVRGTLAGQWFASPDPPSGMTPPDALTPRLAVVREQLSGVSISRRSHGTVRLCTLSPGFGLMEVEPYCMVDVPTPPERVFAPTTPGSRSGICYPTRRIIGRDPGGMPVFESEGYFRFVLDARDHETGAEALWLFQGTGTATCPMTGSAELTTIKARLGEAAEGPYYR